MPPSCAKRLEYGGTDTGNRRVKANGLYVGVRWPIGRYWHAAVLIKVGIKYRFWLFLTISNLQTSEIY